MFGLVYVVRFVVFVFGFGFVGWFVVLLINLLSLDIKDCIWLFFVFVFWLLMRILSLDKIVLLFLIVFWFRNLVIRLCLVVLIVVVDWGVWEIDFVNWVVFLVLVKVFGFFMYMSWWILGCKFCRKYVIFFLFVKLRWWNFV